VIAAGGGKMGTRSGDAYVAFTLPDPVEAVDRHHALPGYAIRFEGERPGDKVSGECESP